MAKNGKQQRRMNARKQARLQKAANTTTEQRASKRQLSSAAIEVVRKVMEILKPFELSRTQRNCTFATMMMDDCVFAGFDSRATSIELAQSNGRLHYKKDSPKSKELKEFLEYNMKMMQGSPRSVGRSSAEMITYGWAPHEIVTHKQDGEYSDLWTLKKLAYIHPLSLDQGKPFEVKEGGDKISHLRQSSTAFAGTNGQYAGNRKAWSGMQKIDFRRVVAPSYLGLDCYPQGISVFDAIYTNWRERQLLSDILLNGVQRDFSGTPILRLPSTVLEQAESDPSSPEAAQVLALSQGMHEMHSGDTTFMILPSDAQSENGTGLRDYEIQFLGVEGGGKGFDIVEILEQKRKSIHHVLTTQHLLAGENGGGSYNLHEGQVSTSALASERDNLIIDEMWNKVIFPKLLRLNNISYTYEDLPVWKHGEAQPISLEETSKAFQRMQNFLPIIPEVVNRAMEINQIDYKFDEDMTTEELLKVMPPQLSKGGEDNGGTSGTGVNGAQSADAGSETNNENKA